mmetsp:Transcript_9240/g.19974  ORF Transcript_9240/g.19974 Transcript_9240/m.19974 type:complete len:115 (+) Transcript_9240:817-1161(+)
MPSTHDPPPLEATPSRSILKTSLSTPDIAGSTPEYEEEDSVSTASDSRSTTRLTRKASWSDDNGLKLSTVHHVYDTHYKRGFFKRYRNEICCTGCLLCVCALATLIYLSISSLR